MLVGLRDLDQSQAYVQEKLIEAINNLTALGVAGFRVDAMKHMWPRDVEKVWQRLKPLDASIYGENASAFMYHEVSFSPGEVSMFLEFHMHDN